MDLVESAGLILRESLKDLKAIYWFGSLAQGSAPLKGDLDWAVLFSKPAPAEPLWNLSAKIASEIHKDVDLVDLKRASTVFQMQVVSTGKRIYCADQKFCELFEDLVSSKYLFLNEERRFILEDIQKRGTIYE